MRKSVLTVLLFITWVLLTWPFKDGIDYGSLIVGFFFSVFTGYVFGERFTENPHKFFGIKRYFWAFIYLFVFLYYCILANLDVAYRVLHPSLPIMPGIVKVKTNLKSKSGLTALANSITLTPGTMTVDIDPDGFLYIHWIYVRSKNVEKATEIIVRRFEKILKRIFE